MHKLFCFLITIALISCKSYHLDTSSLKKQYAFKDTSVIYNPEKKEFVFKKSPDSITCVNRSGDFVTIDVRSDYKFNFEYVLLKNNIYHKESVFLKPKQFYLNDSILFSIKPIAYSGTGEVHTINTRDIRKIKVLKYKNFANRFSIKTSPLSLINFIDGFSFKLGLEKRIYRNFSLCVEGGPYFSYGGKGLWSGSKGYLVNPEMRLYLNTRGQTTGNYLSLDYRLKNRSFNWEDSILIPQTIKNSFYLKEYRIQTITNCFNIKYGLVSLINSLVIDCFVGVGIKFRNSTSDLTKEEEENIYGANNYSTFQMYRSRRGKFIAPNVTAGIKIGFCFK